MNDTARVDWAELVVTYTECASRKLLFHPRKRRLWRATVFDSLQV